MADIRIGITGDSRDAQTAFRDAGEAASEMGGSMDEAAAGSANLSKAQTETADSTKKLGAETEKTAKSSDGMALKFALVAKAAKEIIRFVGDSVKTYLDAADANSKYVAVANQFNEAEISLKKSVGEATLKIAEQLQLAEAAKGAIGWLQSVFKGDTDENIGREQRMNELLAAQAELRSARIKGAADDIEKASQRVLAAQLAMGIAKGQEIGRDFIPGAADTSKQAAAMAKAQADAAQQAENARLQVIVDYAQQEYEVRKKSAESMAELQQKYFQQALDAERKEEDAILKMQMDAAAKQAEAMQQAEQASLDASIAQSKKVIAQAEKDLSDQKQQFENIGAAIGSSMVSAFTSMLNTMLDGGPNDPSKIILAVLDVIWQVAGYAIGSAMGNPVLGQAIGTLGSAATHGIAAAAKKGQGGGASNMTSRAHDGAWIGAPKYHDGGWAFDEMPAILKMGERVLSEQEISRMGGPQSVDSAARGSGMSMPPMQVNVQAIDSRNATESFVRDLGLALKRARRSGLGSLAIA